MHGKYFREKSDLCFRLADGVSLNSPGRFKLMELAEDFKKRAKELETQGAQQGPQAEPLNTELRGKCFHH